MPDLVKSIQNILFSNPLGDINLPVKSATEMSLRQQNFAKRIGAPFGRLNFEFIVPIIVRGLDILEMLGLISLSGAKVDGRTLGIQYVSPLAQAQDEADLIAHQRFAEIIVNTFGPQVALLLLMKPDYIKSIGTLTGVPQKSLPDEQELQAALAMIMQMFTGQQSQGAPTSAAA
jgi:hypothetical protein